MLRALRLFLCICCGNRQTIGKHWYKWFFDETHFEVLFLYILIIWSIVVITHFWLGFHLISIAYWQLDVNRWNSLKLSEVLKESIAINIYVSLDFHLISTAIYRNFQISDIRFLCKWEYLLSWFYRSGPIHILLFSKVFSKTEFFTNRTFWDKNFLTKFKVFQKEFSLTKISMTRFSETKITRRNYWRPNLLRSHHLKPFF